MEYLAHSPSDLNAIAVAVAAMLEKTPLVLLYGPMGAGKTTFVSAIATTLGLTGNVSSPTFTIVNEYKTRQQLPAYHIDLYRVKNLREAMDAGIEDYLYSGNICLVEWPELMEDWVDIPFLKITIEPLPDNSRKIRLERLG